MRDYDIQIRCTEIKDRRQVTLDLGKEGLSRIQKSKMFTFDLETTQKFSSRKEAKEFVNKLTKENPKIQRILLEEK